MFDKFVRDFESRLNQLRLVEMGVKVSKELDSMSLYLYFAEMYLRRLLDPQIHLAFLMDLLSRVDTEHSKDAHVLLLASLARAKLLYGDAEGTKKDIDEAWKILDELTGVENMVNAAYYGVAADYYKVSGSFRLSRAL